MNTKKKLTIHIATDSEEEDEEHILALRLEEDSKSLYNKYKDLIEIHKKIYEEEVEKINSTNVPILSKILKYMEGENQFSDISYNWYIVNYFNYQ